MGFLKKYRGCSIIDTPTTYVITNDHGRTIGESKTIAGCEGIIDNYKDKTEENTMLTKEQIEQLREEIRDKLWEACRSGDDSKQKHYQAQLTIINRILYGA